MGLYQQINVLGLLEQDNVCYILMIDASHISSMVILYLVPYRYPADLFTRAKIESILDWHHTNLRRGAGEIQHYSWLVPLGYSGDIIHGVGCLVFIQ